MSYHEERLAPGGDPAPGAPTVFVYYDDQGNAYYPGDEGYVEPEAGNEEYLKDRAESILRQYQEIKDAEAKEEDGDKPAPSEEEKVAREAIKAEVRRMQGEDE